MWLIFSAVSMSLCAAYELLGTRIMQSDEAYMAVKLKITVIGIEFVAGLALYFTGKGESGLSPLHLIAVHPLIALSTSFTVLSGLLYLWGLKFVGLSIQEALSGFSGVLIFLAIICTQMFTGRLAAASQLYIPYRLIPIIIMLVGTCILPNLNRGKRSNDVNAPAHTEILPDFKARRLRLIKGLVITFAAVFCDAGDSLLISIIMDEGNVGTIDYMIAAYTVAAVWGVLLYGWICFREKKPFNPIRKRNLSICIYAVTIILHSAFYLMGIYASPVKSTVLWCAYPILPLIAAKFILKERYSVSQYICIWATALASVAFCLFDVLM